jgi:RNA-binding protein
MPITNILCRYTAFGVGHRAISCYVSDVSNSKLPAGRGKSQAKVPELTGKDRRNLRALGHALSPVVQVGKAGLSQGVTDELQRALKSHELIKVRLLGECPLDRAEAGERIAAVTHSTLIQTLGGILLFYQPNLEKPKISLTQPELTEKAPGGKAKALASRRRLPPSRTGATHRRSRSSAAKK